MAIHGIDRVRGGTYAQIHLPYYQTKTLTDELKTVSNSCFHCGMTGHYIKTCPQRPHNSSNEVTPLPPISGLAQLCTRCGRNSHKVQDCYATTNIQGLCSRCRRAGHADSQCYAKTDIVGNSLSN